MKNVILAGWLAAFGSLLANCHTAATAQETGAYPNGTSGLLAGTVPPPGQYYIMYNRLYSADRQAGPGAPMPMDLDIFANVHRYINITEYKFFGADYGWNIVMPVVSVDVDIDAFGIHDNAVKIGDMNIEPFVIEWHEKQYDFGYVYGFFAPTAPRSQNNPALPGKKFWTNYFGVAGTYWFDDEKSWAISALSRYEIHSKREDIDYHPGDDLSVEWGFSKQIDKVLTVGVSGYCAWQMTNDTGSAVPNPTWRDEVYAIGPEVQYFSTKYKFGYQARFWWEFGARNRTEGTIATFTLVKPF